MPSLLKCIVLKNELHTYCSQHGQTKIKRNDIFPVI